jgi:2'-5' RNA ligase
VRSEIARAQSQLHRHAPPGAIRWTRPEQFHVTLKFLGDVPADSLDALEKSAATVCAGFPSLQMSAHGIGFFPSERKPRVLWAGADDVNGQLAELHVELDEALRWLAPAEKPERFSGHLTLGRFKPGHHGSMENLMKRATLLRDRYFGDWQASQVELIRSELTSIGATHLPIAALPLAG